jgi:guanylate kinase
MKQAAKPAGTPKTATKASILETELARLQETRARMKDGNQRYVDRHPELRTIMDEFVSATIAQKPNDIIKFGAKWFQSLREGQKGHPPLIITGPSGAGMSTMVKKLMTKYPQHFKKPLETTTRAPKDYETDGEDFFFVDEATFQAMIDRGDFITWSPVYENFYGMSLEAVERVVEAGKIAIMDLAIDALGKYRDTPLDIKYLFVAPPSLEVLEDRLLGAQRYNPQAIDDRLEKAPDQIERGMNSSEFDACVTNDELEPSFNDIVFQIMQWYPDADIDPPDSVAGSGAASKNKDDDAKSQGTKNTSKSKKSKESGSTGSGSKK